MSVSPTPDFFKPQPEASVLVGCRFHDMDRLDLLARAVNSILSMTNVDITCHVICQDFSASEMQRVSSVLEPYERIHDTSVELVNVELSEPRDARALLLNRTLDFVEQNTDIDYLMFVDYDDIVFSHAAIVLVNSLLTSRCDFAYGNILCADEVFIGQTRFTRNMRDLFNIGRRYRPDLYTSNFLPLHSYMFRAQALREDGIRYDEDLSRLEDYDFLLRFLLTRPASPLVQNILIGVYNFYSDAVKPSVNTTENPFLPLGVKDSLWSEANDAIRAKLADQPLLPFASDHQLGGS